MKEGRMRVMFFALIILKALLFRLCFGIITSRDALIRSVLCEGKSRENIGIGHDCKDSVFAQAFGFVFLDNDII